MLRKALIVATVALAVMAPAGSSRTRRRRGRRRRARMESDSPGHRSCTAQRPDAALLRDGAHRHVRRDQRDRAGVHAVSCQIARRLRIADRGGGAGGARRARRHQPGRLGDLQRGARPPARRPSIGLRPAWCGSRRPGCQGSARVAPERRVGRVAVPALRRAATARTLAADAASQRERGLHACSVGCADGAAHADAVSAGAACLR